MPSVRALNQRKHHEAWDEIADEIKERSALAVRDAHKAGANPLADNDELFWRHVKRICGEQYVGKPLTEIHREVRRLADLENARGRPQMRQGRVEPHWAYKFDTHMAALQLDAAISLRIARAEQKKKYGETYL
jgi:hypothetical protein